MFLTFLTKSPKKKGAEKTWIKTTRCLIFKIETQ